MTEAMEKNIRGIFSSISSKYDLFDSMISLGMDGKWRRKLIETMEISGGISVLDAGAGSGKVSFEIRSKYKNIKIIALDITPEMFPHSKETGISFIEGSAVNMPFSGESFERVVSAFLTRNVPSLDSYLEESFRVLRHGGLFCNMDIFDPGKLFFGPLFRFYFYRIVPIVFDMLSSSHSYSYLASSVKKFVSPAEFSNRMKKTGFVDIKQIILGGGSIAIHRGFKE